MKLREHLLPIQDEEGLLDAVQSIHSDCFGLIKQALGHYLPVSGNMGVFCHFDDEYDLLVKIRDEMVEPSDNPRQKYYLLREPIVISPSGNVPKAVYSYLYIRKPDLTPYGNYQGDVDFLLDSASYLQLKKKVRLQEIEGAVMYDRPGWDTVQITSPEINSVAYISTKEMAEKARVKFD